jgi:ubiquinol-cytochrome c reductase cytochrome b subunit
VTTTSDTRNDLRTPPRTQQQRGVVGAISNYVDERTSISGFVRELARKVFPDHWSFMLGEVALWCFIIVLLTGTFLTFFFQASMAPVEYDGSYVPLKGMEMSAAMASTLDISFDVRGGLLVRQIHHWAALLFIATIMLHMARVFFTGAFRKPRELNWVIGFIMWILAMGEGFTGYSLPDDLLSGNGLRIIDGLIKGIPIVGTWTSYIFFGGEFPGTQIVGRLYTLHILLLPALLVALVGLHMVFLIVHKHTQFAGPGKTNDNVVGYPILPVYGAKMAGTFFLVFGVIVMIAALFTINPIWNYGPYDPSPVSAGTQPDWYIGFADGALRLVPPGWEIVLFNTWTLSLNILMPIVAITLWIVLALFYPFIEGWITGDKREHHLAERPRNQPTRTAIGVAGIVFYGSMFVAASSDLIATHFQMSMENVIHILQFTLLAGPFIAFFITKRICIALQKKDREMALHGYESGRIVRLPGGEFVEVHQPLDDYERWRLVSFLDYKPLMIRPNSRGQISPFERVRAVLSRWFFEDRITPVTRGELAASHAHGHGGGLEEPDLHASELATAGQGVGGPPHTNP